MCCMCTYVRVSQCVCVSPLLKGLNWSKDNVANGSSPVSDHVR